MSLFRVVPLLREWRVQYAGNEFVGCQNPGSDAALVLADQALERAGWADVDSLGFVFECRSDAIKALASITNANWRQV